MKGAGAKYPRINRRKKEGELGGELMVNLGEPIVNHGELEGEPMVNQGELELVNQGEPMVNQGEQMVNHGEQMRPQSKADFLASLTIEEIG